MGQMHTALSFTSSSQRPLMHTWTRLLVMTFWPCTRSVASSKGWRMSVISPITFRSYWASLSGVLSSSRICCNTFCTDSNIFIWQFQHVTLPIWSLGKFSSISVAEVDFLTWDITVATMLITVFIWLAFFNPSIHHNKLQVVRKTGHSLAGQIVQFICSFGIFHTLHKYHQQCENTAIPFDSILQFQSQGFQLQFQN